MEEKVESVLNEYIDNKKIDTSNDLKKFTFKQKTQTNWLTHAIYSFVSIVIVLVLSFSFFQLKGSSPKANKEEERYKYSGELYYSRTDLDTATDFILKDCQLLRLNSQPLPMFIRDKDDNKFGIYMQYSEETMEVLDATCFYIFEKYSLTELPIYGLIKNVEYNGFVYYYNIFSGDDVFYSYDISFVKNDIFHYYTINSLVEYDIINFLEMILA